MKLLLDTHAFLWWDSNGARLPAALHAAIASPGSEVFVSAATVWEIAIKRALGKLIFGQPVGQSIEEYGFLSIPITVHHAEWAGGLPQLHRDPFDHGQSVITACAGRFDDVGEGAACRWRQNSFFVEIHRRFDLHS